MIIAGKSRTAGSGQLFVRYRTQSQGCSYLHLRKFCALARAAIKFLRLTHLAGMGNQTDNHDEESWVTLYHTALLELEHAKMAGRIKDARTEIVARVEKLRNMPGLHPDEHQAIADALSSLRSLELEEARQDKEKEQRALDTSLKKLQSIAPAVLKTEKDKDKDKD